jgi:hypothetical protein
MDMAGFVAVCDGVIAFGFTRSSVGNWIGKLAVQNGRLVDK